MSTIRVRKDGRYFSASNEPFNDTKLSWEARGLMGYLLSKPDDWKISMVDLEKKGPAGTHKLRRMLAELRKAGYMNRIRLTIENNKFDWITEVYENPSQNPKEASVRFSTSGSPTSGKVPDIVSTDLTNTDKEKEPVPATQKIFKIYTDNIGAITTMTAERLKDIEKEYADDWFRDATMEAVKNNKRNLAYIEAILKRWKADGRGEKKNEPRQQQSFQPIVIKEGNYVPRPAHLKPNIPGRTKE